MSYSVSSCFIASSSATRATKQHTKDRNQLDSTDRLLAKDKETYTSLGELKVQEEDNIMEA